MHVDIEAIVDRSGSMGHVVDDTIGAYNAWLKGQQALEGSANLTLTLFDNELTTEATIPLDQAKPLNHDRYKIRGSTALNDAMGYALDRMFERNSEKAILVVLTDGQENASVKYHNTAQIKQMVEKAQGRGWQVVYLSADINAFQHAAGYGVLRGTTVQFDRTAAGLQSAFTASASMNTAYRTQTIDDVDPEKTGVATP